MRKLFGPFLSTEQSTGIMRLAVGAFWFIMLPNGYNYALRTGRWGLFWWCLFAPLWQYFVTRFIFGFYTMRLTRKTAWLLGTVLFVYSFHREIESFLHTW